MVLLCCYCSFGNVSGTVDMLPETFVPTNRQQQWDPGMVSGLDKIGGPVQLFSKTQPELMNSNRTLEDCVKLKNGTCDWCGSDHSYTRPS